MTEITIASRCRLSLVAAALAALLVVSALAAPATVAQGPAAMITYVGTQGIQALEGSSAERAARLSRLFLEDFDVNGLGNFALGRYRTMATPLEMQEFYRIYPAFMVRALNYKLDDYRGQAFRVTGKRKIGGETIINSDISARVQLELASGQTRPGARVSDNRCDDRRRQHEGRAP